MGFMSISIMSSSFSVFMHAIYIYNSKKNEVVPGRLVEALVKGKLVVSFHYFQFWICFVSAHYYHFGHD
jgi:hypothetical protein